MASGEDEDVLDAGEAFEKMQLHTITAKDPDSLAYHAALRRTAARPHGAGAAGARHAGRPTATVR